MIDKIYVQQKIKVNKPDFESIMCDTNDCQTSDCCDTRDRCIDNDCSDYGGGWSEKWKKTTPHGTPPYCAGTTCRTNDTECCEKRQKCSSYDCPSNYITKNPDSFPWSIQGSLK